LLPRDLNEGETQEYEQMHYEMIGEIAYDLKLAGLDFSSVGFISGEDEIFSFRRAISRFREMQSTTYQQCTHRAQTFLPYMGSVEERGNAHENRRRREALSVERMKQQQDDSNGEPSSEKASTTKESTVVPPAPKQQMEEYFRETDWGDEASYRSWSTEQEALERKSASKQKGVPKFGEQHFFGFGWWETVKDRLQGKPPRKK